MRTIRDWEGIYEEGKRFRGGTGAETVYMSAYNVVVWIVEVVGKARV
jgi:hypothetical protein